jgi:excisionase family DNA binding protein
MTERPTPDSDISRTGGGRRQSRRLDDRSPSPQPRLGLQLTTSSHTPLAGESDPKRLYSVAAAADSLSITRKHLYTLIGRGEIATVTIGRRRLVPATELDRFVDYLVSAAR